MQRRWHWLHSTRTSTSPGLPSTGALRQRASKWLQKGQRSLPFGF